MNKFKKIIFTSIIFSSFIVSSFSINLYANESTNLFPSRVEEQDIENGRRRIIRSYELSENEDPQNIRTDSFERDGFYFTLSEIMRNTTNEIDQKEHIEIVTINTPTQNLNQILEQLPEYIEYENDGYTGTLTLDLSTVYTTVAGTRTENFTSRQERTFPNLSSPDTSLIPRTINVGGSTYNLSDVNWSNSSTTPIDFTQVTSTVTATAIYTRQGSRNVITGYVTTAQFTGNISKVSQGYDIYTAIFDGEPLIPEFTELTAEELEQSIEEQRVLLAELTSNNKVEEVIREPLNINLGIVFGILSCLGLIGATTWFLLLRKNVEVQNLQDDNTFKKIGKVRTTKKKPIIDLSSFTDKVKNPSFVLIIDQFTASSLNGEMLTINYGSSTFSHIVAYEKGMKKYKAEVDF